MVSGYHTGHLALEQGSANFSVKEQRVNILSCVGYMVSVITTQICHCNAKQSEAKCKLIGMAVFQ